MRKLFVGAAAAAVCIAMTPAFAQVAPPAGVAQGTAPVRTAPVAPAAPETRVMVMAQHEMTRDEVVKHVRDMFARFDTNKDGYVTRDELGAIREMGAMGGEMKKRFAEGGMKMPDPGAMFDRLDTNHDGSISRQEFMAGHEKMHEQRVIVMRSGAEGAPGAAGKMRMHAMGGFGSRLFEMADTNHDGRVSLAEAQAAALAHFDKADLNHDGRITPDEHKQIRMMRVERPAS